MLPTVMSGMLVRLVKLRNPWGHKEWEGRFGDSSHDWTPALLAQYKS